MNKSRSGFTIVELLIVIVVIGILAAITIVAYNGIQEKARLAGALAFERQLRGKYSTDTTGDWSFDECAGTSVKNTGSASNIDNITGTATWITDTPTGKGCALKLNGSSRIETQATLGSTYYVKGAWVRISTASCVNNNMISQALSNGVQAVFYTPSCNLSAGHNGSWNTVRSSEAINDSKWHYVAVIWENTTLTIYLDGKKVDSKTGVVAAVNSGFGVVAIGAHAGGNNTTGDIDNVFIAAQ